MVSSLNSQAISPFSRSWRRAVSYMLIRPRTRVIFRSVSVNPMLNSLRKRFSTASHSIVPMSSGSSTPASSTAELDICPSTKDCEAYNWSIHILRIGTYMSSGCSELADEDIESLLSLRRIVEPVLSYERLEIRGYYLVKPFHSCIEGTVC